MGLLLWAWFGAVVGYLVAQRRGFSPVTGVVAGLVLGPLAVVLRYIPLQHLDDRAPAKVPVLRRPGHV